MAPVSLYWHDYETFGADPRRDRPAQFAGLRTDEDLNPVGAPLLIYCRPADDMLPAPEACLITGITPQKALTEGVSEAPFMAAIHEQLAFPGTCGLGYNTLRFDDEVTRHGLYRNFFDPYEREWRNGNSRWDLIDMVRLTAALRPDGIEWPKDEQGRPSFRLERLTAANGIAHEGAHDALADVHATIELARLIKARQPRLYQFAWDNRGKRQVADMLPVGAFQSVIHVSEKYPAERHCLAVVVPLARHPVNQNGVVVYDLSVDPEPLLALSADELRERLYSPAAQLPEGVPRIPLKTVHLNRCPIIAPLKVARPPDIERLQLDPALWERHLDRLKSAPGLAAKVAEVFARNPWDGQECRDPDLMLYGGGFFSDQDKRRMETIRAMSPEKLAGFDPEFDDPRLPEMLFRYRARNWPQSLNAEERTRWDDYRRRRLTDPEGGGSLTLEQFFQRIDALEAEPDRPASQREVLASLRAYGREIIR